MQAKFVNEAFDFMGWFHPNKKDPFEKSKEYYFKKELRKELSTIITKYKNNLKNEDIISILTDILKK